jgi:hypothetical protein
MGSVRHAVEVRAGAKDFSTGLLNDLLAALRGIADGDLLALHGPAGLGPDLDRWPGSPGTPSSGDPGGREHPVPRPGRTAPLRLAPKVRPGWAYQLRLQTRLRLLPRCSSPRGRTLDAPLEASGCALPPGLPGRQSADLRHRRWRANPARGHRTSAAAAEDLHRRCRLRSLFRASADSLHGSRGTASSSRSASRHPTPLRPAPRENVEGHAGISPARRFRVSWPRRWRAPAMGKSSGVLERGHPRGLCSRRSACAVPGGCPRGRTGAGFTLTRTGVYWHPVERRTRGFFVTARCFPPRWGDRGGTVTFAARSARFTSLAKRVFVAPDGSPHGRSPRRFRGPGGTLLATT